MSRSLLWAVAGLLLLVACSSHPGGSVNNPGSVGELGITVQVPTTSSKHGRTIREDIILPNNSELDTLAYTIDDGQGNTYTGNGDVSSFGGTSGTFIVGGIAPSATYTVSLTGTTTDGLETCNGTSGTFAVAPHLVTDVSVNVICTWSNSADSGAVDITANAAECPIWNWGTALTNPVPVGTSTWLYEESGQAGVPMITWTVITGSGTLQAGSESTFPDGYPNGYESKITFTCPGTAETDTIQFFVQDVDYPDTNNECPASDTTGTVNVTCQ